MLSTDGPIPLEVLLQDKHLLAKRVQEFLLQAQRENIQEGVDAVLERVKWNAEVFKNREEGRKLLRQILGSKLFALLEAAAEVYQLFSPTFKDDLAAAHRLKEMGLISGEQRCFSDAIINEWESRYAESEKLLKNANWHLNPETSSIEFDKAGKIGRRRTLLSLIIERLVLQYKVTNTATVRKHIAHILSPYFPPPMLDTRKDKPISNAIDSALSKMR